VTYLALATGTAMLYLGAELLVGSASRLALSLRIPQLLVGLTVVAYGTSAPEVAVGIEAALAGHGDVAIGNVVGSNLANLGVVLAVTALVRPPRVSGALRHREIPALLASTLALLAVFVDGRVSRGEAAALVAGAVAYTAWAVLGARRPAMKEAETHTRAVAQASGSGVPGRGHGRAWLLLGTAVGLALVAAGGSVFVDAATVLARTWGMSERVLGLTLVAFGTSLPELVTCVVAALRGHPDIAVGNVVGSNIFNVFLCLGAAGLTGNLATEPRGGSVELAVLAAMTLAALYFLRTERTLRRWEGALLLAGYARFLVYLSAS